MLTNRVMVLSADGKSTIPEIKEYSLEDAEFRTTANKLNFICSIGARRFKVCIDKPGYCRHTFYQKCFLGICGKKHREEEYIPAKEKHQFLLDAKAKCFNYGEYPFEQP